MINRYGAQVPAGLDRRLHTRIQSIAHTISGYAVYQRIGYKARRVMTYHGYDAKGMADRFVITLNQHNCLPGYRAFCEAIYE
jgi:hypothetical protein